MNIFLIITHTHTQTYTYMQVRIIDEERGHRFEREQGEVYVKVWREEKKGQNGIIIQSHK